MNASRPGVLIVEDESEIAEMVSGYLSERNFRTFTAGSVFKAREQLKKHKIDVIVLDWMLPGLSGLELLRDLGKSVRSRPGVILLTARSEDSDIVRGLEAGANDYVTKPFSLAVLYARISRLSRDARRTAAAADDSQAEFSLGMARINPRNAKVLVNGQSVKLSETVLRLLVFLHQHPNKIHSRAELLRGAWPPKTVVSSRTVDVHISHLRKFLRDQCGVDALRTVRQEGYMLALDS